MAEDGLEGGITNAGLVVRDGSHVLRPSGPHTESIHHFLRALRHAGFDGAPLPIGVDPDGRERLEFIEGDVALSPYPVWSQSSEALASVAQLLRRFHNAARNFDPGELQWSGELADPEGGTPQDTLLCHNDVEPANVVFRDGIAVALIDFEFAAPGRPVYDVAHLARLWVPIEDDFDQERMGFEPANRPERLRIVADAYGLEGDGRAELLGALESAMEQVELAVSRSVGGGNPRATAHWKQTGGIQKFRRRQRWWRDHHADFAAALQ